MEMNLHHRIIALAVITVILLAGCGQAAVTPAPPTITPPPPAATPIHVTVVATAVPTARPAPTDVPDPGIGLIAFVSTRDGNGEIYVMNADGVEQSSRDQRRLTNWRQWDGFPSWSPDGKQIVYYSYLSNKNWVIKVMDADGSNPRQLTDNGVCDGAPTWSPDGGRIAFNSDADCTAKHREVYLINLDGSGQRNLTNHDADDVHAVWSPDGTQIAFSSNRDGNYEIYVMNVDGSDPRRLTNDDHDDYVTAWSPDGAQIAFFSDRDGNNEIYVMDADGSNLRRLTDNPASEIFPVWSPDGAQIVFSSNRDSGNYDVYVINADGTQMRQLVDSPGEDFNAVWQPMTTTAAIPYWPAKGWRTSTPEEQGMDSEMLAKMFGIIQEQDYEVDSVSVIRNGYLVADAYIHPFHPDSQHVIRSCTKSIVSALVGIAIEQGYIEGVDQPLLDFFPERTVANLDGDKEAMTLEHVLMMASGLECRDSYLYRWRGIMQMRQTEDWVQFVLDLPMAEAPGTRFEYCNGGSFLLSAIIQETTGMSALAFAEEHLFGPLGISDIEWPANPQGISIGWSELRMKPHDMAKIGYLYLNDGLWGGEQIVPAAWVGASTRAHISATLQDGYGYQWWVDDSGIYMALGYGGQFIFVVPEKEMVVVFTSELSESDFYVPQELLNDFITPAAKSTMPLPANPEGVALLEASVKALANP